MSINSIFASQSLQVGSRYIFFQELATQQFDIYKNAYQIGTNLLNDAASQLAPDINENPEGLEKIKNYINLIGEMANNERKNEINFIKQCKNLLLKDKSGALKNKLTQYIDSLENNESFDYLQFIQTINELMTLNSEILNDYQQIAKERLDFLSANFEQLSEQAQEEYSGAFNKNYEAYRKKMQNMLSKIVERLDQSEEKKYQESATTLLSEKINSVLKALAKDRALPEIITNAWSENNWSSEYIAKQLIAIVVKYISSISPNKLKEKQTQDIKKEIENSLIELKDNLTDDYVENICNLVTQRAAKNLEELALTTRRGLADLFLSYTSQEKKKIIEEYGINLNIKEIENLTAPMATAKQKERISKLLITGIRKAAKEQFHEQIEKQEKETVTQFYQRIKKLKKENRDFFKTRNLEKNIQNSISVSISGPDAAEFLASDKFLNGLTQIFVPGHTIQLKTDARATIFFNEDIQFELPETEETIMDALKAFDKNFLYNYKEQGQGKIDVKAASTAYEYAMTEVKNNIMDYIENNKISIEEKQNILSLLQSFFTTGISVKDYTFSTTQLGFHGGSLGFNGEKAAENIEQMYKLGGITPIDKETLYFALINCSEAAIGHALKDNLATYLLGGAALMLFDDGFTASTQFLNNMINNFGFMPNTLHLFFLQTRYVPASYIYTQIYTNLLQAYNEIEANYYSLNTNSISNNNKIIIQNSIASENIPHQKSDYYIGPKQAGTYYTPQSRWDYIAELASKEVKVEMIFMAGLLDIFEKIPQAFNI